MPEAKLTKQEKKRLAAAVKKAKRDGKIPKSAQETIPYREMHRDGICDVDGHYFTKQVEFFDINYQLAQNEDKNIIFENWCDFLNYFDSSIRFQLGIEVTEAVTKEEAQIEGEFVKYRLESSLEEKERRKQLIENNGAKVDELGLTYPVKNSDSEKLIFQDAVRKKMEKLASYRRQGFEKVGLFVFYDEPPIPVRLEELKNYFDAISWTRLRSA